MFLCFFFSQVSRCEKFGYGVMVTQVAATAPGVVALHSSGTKALNLANKFSQLCYLRHVVVINMVAHCATLCGL